MSLKNANRGRFTAAALCASLCALIVAALPGVAPANQGDRNGDGLPDRWERKHNLSLKKNQARRDQDHDGLRNRSEFRAKTHPRDVDTDNDGVSDGDEDRDGDRVDNENEEREHTHPSDKDSDDDGKDDGREDADRDGLNNRGEDASGNDPVDRDTDDDETEDGDENAGKVASYNAETHVLVITMFGGGQVSGYVTDQTRITCVDEDEHEGDTDDGEPGDPPGGLDDPEGEGMPRTGDVDDEAGEPCCSDALTPGTPVHEAALKLTGDGLVFTEIELVK